MRTIKCHDKAIVLILTKKEAEAIKYRLQNTNGVRASKAHKSAEEKLLVELGVI